MIPEKVTPLILLRTIRHRARQLVGACVVLTFALVPVWYRLPTSPFDSPLYVTRFLILLPMTMAIGLWLLAALPGLRDLRRSKWGASWATIMLTLALWAFFSGAWAFAKTRAPDAATNAALTFGTAALFAMVTACVGSPGAIVRALALGLLVNAALTVAGAVGQGDLGLRAIGEFPFAPDMPGVSVIVSGGWRYVRPYGLLPHPNILAGSLLIGLLAAGALYFSGARVWRAIGGAGVIVGTVALLLTFSRAAWVGAAIGGVAFLLAIYPLLRDRRVRARLIALTAAVVLVGGLFFIAYRPLINARVGAGEEPVELRSVADRLVYTDFAIRAIGERPVFGVGMGSFPWRSAAYLRDTFYELRGDNVHHVYLLATAELGIVGGLLLIAALLYGSAGMVAAVRASKNASERATRGALLAAVVALAVIGWFDHYPFTILHIGAAWWGMMGAGLTTPDQTGSSSETRNEVIVTPSGTSVTVSSAP